MYRTTYSVAMCCASAALPPLPQKKSVPPRLTADCTISSARSMSGPSSIATRSAVAASSRSADVKGDVMSDASGCRSCAREVGVAERRDTRHRLGGTPVDRGDVTASRLEGVRQQGVGGEQIERRIARRAVVSQHLRDEPFAHGEKDVGNAICRFAE